MKQASEKPKQRDGMFRSAEVLGTIGNDLVPLTVQVTNKECYQLHGYDHYVNRLSLRKRLGLVAFGELQQKFGREPSEPELKQHLHNSYNAGVAPIAFKGWKDRGKRNYLADEELVVAAAFTAIATGQESLILTRDTDIFEQFIKLMHMLLADYACFRFALVHHANPVDAPMFPLAIEGEGRLNPCIDGDEVQQIIISHNDVSRLPPYEYTPVHAYCVLLGNDYIDPKVSIAAFCLENGDGRVVGHEDGNGWQEH